MARGRQVHHRHGLTEQAHLVGCDEDMPDEALLPRGHEREGLAQCVLLVWARGAGVAGTGRASDVTLGSAALPVPRWSGRR